MTAAIRPRNDWEAIDLGLTLVQANARRVYLAWLIVALPAAGIALFVAQSSQQLWLAYAIFWLQKPLLDRLPLHVLSRALFGQTDTMRTLLRRLPRLLAFNAPLSALTLAHLNPLRSFTQPVMQLEGLRRGAWLKRSQLLMRGVSGTAFLLTLLCWLFSTSLSTTFAAVLGFVAPESVRIDFDALLNAGLPEGRELFFFYLAFSIYFVAESIIEPVYVSCGFTLYLNRRTRLEAWDIELAFRRLAAHQSRPPVRRSATAVTLPVACLVACLALSIPGPAAADGTTSRPAATGYGTFSSGGHDEKSIADAIERVLEHPDFDEYESLTEWVPRFDPEVDAVDPQRPDWYANIGGALAVLAEGIIWIAVAMLALLAFRKRHIWIGRQAHRSAPKPATPVDIAATARRAERALPANIPGRVLELWHAGDRSDALSLLYRGAVDRFITAGGVDIRSSDTEQDCIAAVRATADEALTAYFVAITRAWQMIAYANQSPDDARIDRLCAEWTKRFGDPL